MPLHSAHHELGNVSVNIDVDIRRISCATGGSNSRSAVTRGVNINCDTAQPRDCRRGTICMVSGQLAAHFIARKIGAETV